MISEIQAQEALAVLKEYQQQLFGDIAKKKAELAQVESEIKKASVTPATEIVDLDMSVRLYNLLRHMNVQTASDLSAMTKEKFLSCRYAGKKSLYELEVVCNSYGIPLSL